MLSLFLKSQMSFLLKIGFLTFYNIIQDHVFGINIWRTSFDEFLRLLQLVFIFNIEKYFFLVVYILIGFILRNLIILLFSFCFTEMASLSLVIFREILKCLIVVLKNGSFKWIGLKTFSGWLIKELIFRFGNS